MKPQITLDNVSDDTPAGLILLRLCQEVSLTDPADDTKYTSPWTLVHADNMGMQFVHDDTGEMVLFAIRLVQLPKDTPDAVEYGEVLKDFDINITPDRLIVERAELQPDGRILMVRRDYRTNEIVPRDEPAHDGPLDVQIRPGYIIDPNLAGFLRTQNWGDDDDPEGATLNDDIRPEGDS